MLARCSRLRFARRSASKISSTAGTFGRKSGDDSRQPAGGAGDFGSANENCGARRRNSFLGRWRKEGCDGSSVLVWKVGRFVHLKQHGSLGEALLVLAGARSSHVQNQHRARRQLGRASENDGRLKAALGDARRTRRQSGNPLQRERRFSRLLNKNTA